MTLDTGSKDAVAVRPDGSRRRRWLIALVVVLVVLLAAAALRQALTTRSSAAPATPAPAPAAPAPAATATATASQQSAGVTAAGTANCAARPGDCGYPDAASTGVRTGVTPVPAPCPEITTAGQVVERVALTNCALSIAVPGVVIRDVRMTLSAPESWAVIVRPGGSARIEHVEISGTGTPDGSVQYAVLSLSSLPVVVDHANLHDCQDCVQGDDVTVTNSYIHDLASPPEAHVDGVICTSGCRITVRHNTIVNDHSQTSAVGVFADFAAPRDSVIDDNLLVGGGYTVYGGGPTAKGIAFTNNRFGRAPTTEGGEWGPVSAFEESGNTWSGNVWDDTLQPVR